MTLSTLSDRLTKKIDTFSVTDKAWEVFVVDHINDIRHESEEIEITDPIRDRYRHKFVHLMRDNGCKESQVWIAYLINDLTINDDFTLMDTVLVPNGGYISQLYRRYKTSSTL